MPPAPLLASARAPTSHKFLGNSSPALFQLPHSHPPPARRLEASASFSPSPGLAPSLVPTTPPPRGADTPPGGAWLGAPGAAPFPPRARPGGGRRCAPPLPGAPDRGRWKLRRPPRPPAAHPAAPGRFGERGRDPGAPWLLALPAARQRPEGPVRSPQCREPLEEKAWNPDTCPPN